jgi:L-2-hydroxyglutarate oxidase LhgO
MNKEVKGALYCKSVGITPPYEFTVALAENAIENGVCLKLETEVLNIEKTQHCFSIETILVLTFKSVCQLYTRANALVLSTDLLYNFNIN